MKKEPAKAQRCTCPSGDGSLRWPCPTHPAEAQAVAWQFQDREGKWHGLMDERHRQHTIADGSWPVRALYAAPPSAPEAQAVGGGEVRAWMRRWAFDGVDVMALPKDERPHGWQLRPTTEAKCLDDDVPLCAAPVAQGGGEVVAWIAQCELDSLVAMPEGKRAHGCVWSRPTGQAGVPLYAAPPSAPVGVKIPPRKNERDSDGKFRTIYLFDTPHEQGQFQRHVEVLAQQPSVAPVGVEGFGSRAVAEELLRCFESWEPGVRVLGNVQAKDAADLMRRILAQQPAAVDDAIAGWIADGDTIPACLIEATRNAIRLEFGNNGTDGYYKRILVRVFTALTAQQGGSDNNRQEDV